MPNNRKTDPRIWHPTFLLNWTLVASIEECIEELDLALDHGSLLDVGCGSMPYRELFEVSEYVGCDLYSEKEGVVRCPADQLDFPDDRFDTVVSFQVLEHVERPWEVVKECARVLKPGGKLMITAPFIFPYHPSPSDYYRFSHGGLRYLVQSEGLEVIKQKSQCASLTTMMLLLVVYVSQIAHAVGKRKWLTPISFLGLYILVPLLNSLGVLIESVALKSREFKGMPAYSNLVLVASKP